MSEIVDANGNEYSTTAPDRCEKCGAPEKHHQTVEMFGGFKKIICKKCGMVIRSWRE